VPISRKRGGEGGKKGAQTSAPEGREKMSKESSPIRELYKGKRACLGFIRPKRRERKKKGKGGRSALFSERKKWTESSSFLRRSTSRSDRRGERGEGKGERKGEGFMCIFIN